MSLQNLIYIFILIYFMISCSSPKMNGTWFVEGDNLQFVFDENKLILKDGENIHVEAKLMTRKQERIIYLITRTSKHPVIRDKYKENQYLTLLNPVIGEDKITFKIDYQNTYSIYNLKKINETKELKYFSLLNPFEIKDFLQDNDFYPASKKYLTKVIAVNPNINNKSKELITNQSHIDLPITNWSQLMNGFIEFFFLDLDDKLLNTLKVRGVAFIQRDEFPFKDRYGFHRLKKIKMEFTKKNIGGLGYSRGQYNSNYFDITLKDTPNIQIIYFNHIVYSRSIRLTVKELYPGVTNQIANTQIIFYLTN